MNEKFLYTVVILCSVLVLISILLIPNPTIKYWHPTASDIPSMINDLSVTDSNDSVRALIGFERLPANARPQAVDALIVELEKQENKPETVDPDLARNILTTLKSLGPYSQPAIPFIIEFLESEVPWVQEEAIMALGNIRRDPDLVIPTLYELLEHRNEDIREKAVMALIQYGEVPELPIFISYGSSYGSPIKREFVDHIELVRWCIPTLGNRSEIEIWPEVIEVLKILGNDSEEALPVLRKIARNRDPEISNAAHEAIDEIEAAITDRI